MTMGSGTAMPVHLDVIGHVLFWVAIDLVVLLAGLVTAVAILGRRPGRLHVWRRTRLQISEVGLGRGSRRALVRLRLRVDDSVALARSAAESEPADFDDRHLLALRLQTTATRVGKQIDALLGGRLADQLPPRLVVTLEERVGSIEAAAQVLVEATSAVVIGATDVELQRLDDDVRGHLELIGWRTEALRDLSLEAGLAVGRDDRPGPSR